MGIKVKILFLLMIFFLEANSQNTKPISLLEEAKGFVLCNCIRKEYAHEDSIFAKKIKDYSESYYFQVSKLPLPVIEKLSYYVDNNAAKYRAIPSEKSPANPTANMVVYTCLKLYKSNALNNYIKRLIGISLKKK